jgi:hypothetical protein
MDPRDEKFLKAWTVRRKSGKWSYAINVGVFMFAWPAFVISELFKYFLLDTYQPSMDRIITRLIVWSISGFLVFGLFQWKAQEKRFEDLMKPKE